MPLRRAELSALSLIKLFIEENFDKTITITMLAEKVWESNGFEPVIFNRIKLSEAFKKTFLSSIHEYHESIRMEKAKKLLIETDDTVKTIALALGYAGPHKFIPIFKRRFGKSPSLYRTTAEKTSDADK